MTPASFVHVCSWVIRVQYSSRRCLISGSPKGGLPGVVMDCRNLCKFFRALSMNSSIKTPQSLVSSYWGSLAKLLSTFSLEMSPKTTLAHCFSAKSSSSCSGRDSESKNKILGGALLNYSFICLSTGGFFEMPSFLSAAKNKAQAQ